MQFVSLNGSVWEKMSTGSGPTTNWGTYFTKYAAAITSFSTFSVFSSPIIPVTMTYFKGKVKNSDAHLVWETAIEFNNAGFGIEKSNDGIHFSNIGFVKGHGNSFVQNEYIFVDNVFSKSAYYRLNQIGRAHV